MFLSTRYNLTRNNFSALKHFTDFFVYCDGGVPINRNSLSSTDCENYFFWDHNKLSLLHKKAQKRLGYGLIFINLWQFVRQFLTAVLAYVYEI